MNVILAHIGVEVVNQQCGHAGSVRLPLTPQSSQISSLLRPHHDIEPQWLWTCTRAWGLDGPTRKPRHLIRVFLNLCFAKPMVWERVAFHENDGNHENDENDEDNSDSYKQGVECRIRGNHGNHENDENHENPGCKPPAPNHGFRNARIIAFWEYTQTCKRFPHFAAYVWYAQMSVRSFCP